MTNPLWSIDFFFFFVRLKTGFQEDSFEKHLNFREEQYPAFLITNITYNKLKGVNIYYLAIMNALAILCHIFLLLIFPTVEQ